MEGRHRLVPKRLMEELLDFILNESNYLNSVITGDESWMFEYDPVLKR